MEEGLQNLIPPHLNLSFFLPTSVFIPHAYHLPISPFFFPSFFIETTPFFIIIVLRKKETKCNIAYVLCVLFADGSPWP